MNPELIRKIDKFAGIPACAALTLHRMLRRRVRGETPPDAPVRKVLFIKMTEQGATLLAYRAIEEVVARVGRENAYFWTFEENRAIIDMLNMVPPQNVIGVRSKNPLLFAMDGLRSLQRVRELGIDATIDLEQFTRAPAILAYLTGATRRAGLHRFTSEAPYRGDLLTHRVQYNAYLHTARNYHHIAQALFEACDQAPFLKRPVPDTLGGNLPRFEPGADEVARVRHLLEVAAGGPVARRVVLLNPNASDLLPLRKWPAERFVALGRRLVEAHDDVTVVFTGGPEERDAAEAITRAVASPRAVSMAGRTSLRDLFVLYTLSDVLVTNDSGPAHFASMTDVAIVTLFGPETPLLYGPLGKRSHVVWAQLACSPCVNAFNHRFSPCRDNVCMQAITVEQVYDRVQTCLGATRSAVAGRN